MSQRENWCSIWSTPLQVLGPLTPGFLASLDSNSCLPSFMKLLKAQKSSLTLRSQTTAQRLSILSMSILTKCPMKKVALIIKYAYFNEPSFFPESGPSNHSRLGISLMLSNKAFFCTTSTFSRHSWQKQWSGTSDSLIIARNLTHCVLNHHFLFYLFIFLKLLYWSIIALQWCVSSCFITKWISCTYTYIPISPPSCVSLPSSLSHPSRWSQSTELIFLCYAAASH